MEMGWFISQTECYNGYFCPLITVWNLIPFFVFLMIGFYIGYEYRKREKKKEVK